MLAESYKDEIAIIYDKIRIAKTRLLEIQGANVDDLTDEENDLFDGLDNALADVKTTLSTLMNNER